MLLGLQRTQRYGAVQVVGRPDMDDVYVESSISASDVSNLLGPEPESRVARAFGRRRNDAEEPCSIRPGRTRVCTAPEDLTMRRVS